MLLLICAGLLIRLYNVIAASAIDFDGMEYAKAARDFASGAFVKALANVRVPAYPAAVGLFHVFIPDVELAGRLVSLVSGILLIVVCFRYAKQFWGEEKAYILAVLVAVHPYMAIYSSRMLAESLATLLFTACLFSFYKGWTTHSSRQLALSGILLTLTYLARPEHIIFFVPLTIVLLLTKERRLRDTTAFLACSLVLIFAFLVYLRVHSGFWIIDRKMLFWVSGKGTGSVTYLSQIITDPFILTNIPRVFYHFCEAVFPPFLLLAVFGFRRAPKALVTVILLLVAFHVFGRGLVHHTTKRYSIEFVPMVMVFAVYGVSVVKEWWAGIARRQQIAAGLFIVAAAVSLFHGIVFPNPERQLEKKAGLFLAGYEAGSSITSRLPLINFYANGKWTNLELMLDEARSCEALDRAMIVGEIKYLVLDTKIERLHPFVAKCVTGSAPLATFDRGDEHMRIYRRVGS